MDQKPPDEAGSGTICVNGAAARLASRGDKVIIAAYALRAGSVITAHSVTSLPVPAVVGTHTSGGIRTLIGWGSAHS